MSETELSDLRQLSSTLIMQCGSLERALVVYPFKHLIIQHFLDGHIKDQQALEEYIAHRTRGGFVRDDGDDLWRRGTQDRVSSAKDFMASLPNK